MALPQAPKRENFSSQEEFEESMGFWQSRVGRIQGMAARAKQTEAAPSPTTEVSTDQAKKLP
jgi:hypothetical protein